VEQLPNGVYYAAGFLLLSNLGVFGILFKGVWWVAKADSRLEQVEKDLDFLFQKTRAERPGTKGES
jgi:hypothetical protein